MRRLLLISLSLITSLGVMAQTARVQIIHNSPDPAADTVNVFANNNALLTDFAYQEATPFIDVAAGSPIDISVLPQGVTDTSQAVYSTQVTFSANQSYVVVADGIVNTSNFATSNVFDLEVYAGAQEQANTAGDVDLLIHHGSPDAPAVDIVEVGQNAGTVVNNLEYPNFTGYAPFVPQDYIIQVKDSTQSVDVREYLAPLQSLNLADSAVVLAASGLLNRFDNPGEPFQVIAVLPNGAVLELPMTTSKAQVIHNVADPAASAVDVWINDQKAIPNFPFRTATPFVDVPANSDLTVSLTATGSSDTSGALLTQTLNVPRDSAFVVVASGVSNNPNFDSIKPLALNAAPAFTESPSSGDVAIQIFHGATDAGPVSVDETTVPVPGLVSNLSYGQFSGYLNLSPQDYELDLLSDVSNSVVAQYGAPLQTLNLADSALVVLASGFTDTIKGTDTVPAFGLYAALPTGGPLVPLPVISGIGLEEAGIANLKIFPNPATDRLNVEWNEAPADEIRLIDLTGRAVKNKAVKRTEQKHHLNVSDLESGIYLLQLRDKGENIATFKVQVQ